MMVGKQSLFIHAILNVHPLESFYISFTNSVNGRVGFEIENVTVIENAGFARVRISFLVPFQISNETFAELRFFTMDGTALGKHAGNYL